MVVLLPFPLPLPWAAQAVNSLGNVTQEGGQLLQTLWHNVTRFGEQRLSAIVEMMQTAAVDAQLRTCLHSTITPGPPTPANRMRAEC